MVRSTRVPVPLKRTEAVELLARDSATPVTFGEARDHYLARATLKSRHTVAAYRRSIECFLEYLDSMRGIGSLPILQRLEPAELTPVNALSPADAPLLLAFAEWLLDDSVPPDDPRTYAASTVRLRVSGVSRWLQYLDDFDWLPSDFPLAKAQRVVRDEIRTYQRSGRRAPDPPRGVQELLTYFRDLRLPKRLSGIKPEDPRLRRWELTRLRNHALVWALAESGGRISEVLSLSLTDLAVRDLSPPFSRVVRVRVEGKGRHPYDLRFHKALPALAAYIRGRGPNVRAPRGQVPLFVSHDPRADGKRLSRTTAWRVITAAARALGLRPIHPHDLRHWRATELVNSGQPLDVVQDYLGHRSVETTRAYYARTDPLRVDRATQATPVTAASLEGGSAG